MHRSAAYHFKSGVFACDPKRDLSKGAMAILRGIWLRGIWLQEDAAPQEDLLVRQTHEAVTQNSIDPEPPASSTVA